MFASRAAFVLAAWGGFPKVMLLDGGFKKWVADGMNVEEGEVAKGTDIALNFAKKLSKVTSFEEVCEVVKSNAS